MHVACLVDSRLLGHFVSRIVLERRVLNGEDRAFDN
jgi:hypothetical protein